MNKEIKMLKVRIYSLRGPNNSVKSDEHWMGSAESLELLELELGGCGGGWV